MKIAIKETDLLDNSSSINKRFLDRYNLITKVLFEKRNEEEFLGLFKELRKKAQHTSLSKTIDLLYAQILIFLFIKHSFSIDQLAEIFDENKSTVSWFLRGKLGEVISNPVKLNGVMQVDDLMNDRTCVDINSVKLACKLNQGSDDLYAGIKKVDINFLLESRGWEKIMPHFGEKEISTKNFIIKSINEKSFSKIFVSYIVLTVLMSIFLFLALKVNEINQEKLVSKLEVPSRFFTWLEANETFSKALNSEENISVKSFNTTVDDVSEKFILEEDRFEVESDVTLASLNELERKDLTDLEETTRGGFRDTRFGRRKVYRVMIKSTDVINASSKITDVMENYSVTKGGNVEPGAKLPGGLYYNLLVPTKNLKGFLSSLDKEVELNIYLSKSKLVAPAGQTNVFLWVKKI